MAAQSEARSSPFLWGQGGRKMTLDEIRRERDIAEQLLYSASDTSPVGHWTAAAARAVQGLGGTLRKGRAGRAEEELMDASQARMSALLSTAPFDPYADYAPAAATMPQGANAAAVRQGLIARGLPEHVADAFVVNFQDESGLNPGINERNPIVKGSRGGFGLYQLTGPRRRAYEAYAAQRGVQPSSADAQLDFLMAELQGPEASAGRAILSAPDTGTAAAAIVNKFLRPSEKHRASRERRYLALRGRGSPTNLAQAGTMPIGPTAPPGAGGMQLASLNPDAQVAGALAAPSGTAPSPVAPQNPMMNPPMPGLLQPPGGQAGGQPPLSRPGGLFGLKLFA